MFVFSELLQCYLFIWCEVVCAGVLVIKCVVRVPVFTDEVCDPGMSCAFPRLPGGWLSEWSV